MKTALVVAMFLLGACDVGEVPIGPGGGTDAGLIGSGGSNDNGGSNNDNNNGSGSDANNGMGPGKSFNAIIAPLVTRCTGCHSGGQTPTLTSFMALEAKYKVKPGAQNILVTEGNSTNGVHNGVQYFSATDQTTVANWIDSLP